MLKANKANLKKIENLFKEAGYRVRYGKGNFQAGYCINAHQKQVIVNKYYHLEAKFSLLIEILQGLEVNPENLSADFQKTYQGLTRERKKEAVFSETDEQ